MFAQVACAKCQKPFQVPETQVGQSVACPWCKDSTPALPVSGLVIEALPDADLPAPPSPAVAPKAEPVPGSASPAPPKPDRPARRLAKVLLLTLLSGLALVVSLFGSRYYRGEIPGFAWSRFTAADGSCRIDLPGRTTESELTANPEAPVTLPGKKFTSSSWFTRLSGFVGWYELDPTRIPLTRAEDAFAAEMNRRKTEMGWTIESEATAAKVGGSDATEVRYTDGSRKFVERYIFVTKGPKPRLYVLGIGGAGLIPDGEIARTVLSSFWFEESK